MQLFYVLYRWVLMIYFFAWLVVTGVDANTSGFGAKYLIYLTYWAFLVWNLYLIVAAVSTTVQFLQIHFQFCKPNEAQNDLMDYQKVHLIHASGTSWFNKVHWIFFTLGTELAVGVSILFWLFFYDSEKADFLFSPIILHVHMINGISALVDLWIVSIPIRLLHVIYPISFGLIYAAFTGFYYAFNGTDISGNHYIYPILDYDSNPGMAARLLIGCILGYLTAIHFLFFLIYIVRNWITENVVSGRSRSRSGSPYAVNAELSEMESTDCQKLLA